MYRINKKILATLLALVIVLGMAPLSALAAVSNIVVVGFTPMMVIDVHRVMLSEDGKTALEEVAGASLTVKVGAEMDVSAENYLIGSKYDVVKGADKYVTELRALSNTDKKKETVYILQYKLGKGNADWQTADAGDILFIEEIAKMVPVKIHSVIADDTNDSASVGDLPCAVLNAQKREVKTFTLPGNGETEIELPVGEYTVEARNAAYETRAVDLSVTEDGGEATLNSARRPAVVTVKWTDTDYAPKVAGGIDKSMLGHTNFILRKPDGEAAGYTRVVAEGGSSTTQTFTYAGYPLYNADGSAIGYTVDETSNSLFASKGEALSFTDFVRGGGKTKYLFGVALDNDTLTITNRLLVNSFKVYVNWKGGSPVIKFYNNNLVLKYHGEELVLDKDYSASNIKADKAAGSYIIQYTLLRANVSAKDLEIYERHVRWDGTKDKGAASTRVEQGETVYLRGDGDKTRPYRVTYGTAEDGSLSIDHALLPTVTGSIKWSGKAPEGAKLRLTDGQKAVKDSIDSGEIDVWNLASGDDSKDNGKVFSTESGFPVEYQVEAYDELNDEWVNSGSVTVGGVVYEMTQTRSATDFNELTVRFDDGKALEATFKPNGVDGAEAVTQVLEKDKDGKAVLTMPTAESLGWKQDEYLLAGWADTANADRAQYLPDETVALTKDAAFYAVWIEKDITGEVRIDYEVTDGKKMEAGNELTLHGYIDGFEGKKLKYQWQSSTDGENWKNVEKANDINYTFKLKPKDDGMYWRLLVTVVGEVRKTGD